MKNYIFLPALFFVFMLSACGHSKDIVAASSPDNQDTTNESATEDTQKMKVENPSTPNSTKTMNPSKKVYPISNFKKSSTKAPAPTSK